MKDEIIFKGLSDKEIINEINEIQIKINTIKNCIGRLYEEKEFYQQQLKGYIKDIEIRLNKYIKEKSEVE